MVQLQPIDRLFTKKTSAKKNFSLYIVSNLLKGCFRFSAWVEGRMGISLTNGATAPILLIVLTVGSKGSSTISIWIGKGSATTRKIQCAVVLDCGLLGRGISRLLILRGIRGWLIYRRLCRGLIYRRLCRGLIHVTGGAQRRKRIPLAN